jgi:hypothetical protein
MVETEVLNDAVEVEVEEAEQGSVVVDAAPTWPDKA